MDPISQLPQRTTEHITIQLLPSSRERLPSRCPTESRSCFQSLYERIANWKDYIEDLPHCFSLRKQLHSTARLIHHPKQKKFVSSRPATKHVLSRSRTNPSDKRDLTSVSILIATCLGLTNGHALSARTLTPTPQTAAISPRRVSACPFFCLPNMWACQPPMMCFQVWFVVPSDDLYLGVDGLVSCGSSLC